MPEYDYVCTTCIGSGTTSHGGEGSCCVTCQGYGLHLTQEGEELIEFLKRRGIDVPMSPLAEEELRGMIE